MRDLGRELRLRNALQVQHLIDTFWNFCWRWHDLTGRFVCTESLDSFSFSIRFGFFFGFELLILMDENLISC